MKSNATLLTFLTISNELEENIIFAFIKELEEVAPERMFWYNKRGKNGSANTIWENKKLKQWCVIGKDSEIYNIFQELITNKVFIYNWVNIVSVTFKIPKVKQKLNSNSLMLIDSICPCGRNEYPDEYICDSWPYDISFLLDEKNNCNYIEGYKKNDLISPIKPYGLFSENYIYEKIKENVCLVYNKRGTYYTISADRKSIKDNIENVYGFIQSTKEFRKTHRIVIKDIDGLNIIGTSSINIDTGKWEAKLTESKGKGQFLIQNIFTKEYSCGEKYYFIKDVSINSQIINNVLVDLFGRKISLTSKPEIQLPIKDSIIWDSKSAPNLNQAEIELSDKLTNIILSIGNNIIFNDPYFMGDFIIENGELKIPSKSQFIFINSLIIAIAKGQIEKIVFIGNWKKAKNFTSDDKSNLIIKYKLLYKVIKQNLEKLPSFKLKQFEIVFSEQQFHDRYWASNNNENEVIYHISNSINGAFESGELKITLMENNEVMKIKPRIRERLKNPIDLI